MPYDASPLARAALVRAARAVRNADEPYTGIILATAGIDPSEIDALVCDAQATAGEDVPLEVRLLSPGDPLGALRRLSGDLPDAVLAAPLCARVHGRAPWYADACVLGGRNHSMMLFFIGLEEIRRFDQAAPRHRRATSVPAAVKGVIHERPGLGGPVGAVLRIGARLRLGV